ncbi:peptidase U32 family protein [Miniphocaeibacter massiliensis]|uniref:peptidase U32 family protein n=1 Tax=Miniphocaeibacter massiliensis TaxID=2041841 RepID=UPI000C08D19B|nr:U32 family peptidase [Miniphocaeibacter massiliensis]
MNKVELLAPAGDLEKLKIAIMYGADAVYLAGEAFGMRKASKNFDEKQLKEGVEFAHSKGKKIYVTLNIIPHNDDLVGLEDYVNFLSTINVDALIVSDPGIYSVIRSVNKDIEVHLSTQASVTNYQTVKFWGDMGVKRIVLARELSLKEISQIKENVPNVDLEVFVHGAMCISYSGRCLLSNYMTGRDANRGDCAQACRWKYNLVEEKRPGEYYPIEETEQGTFIYNSKDLCMMDSLDDLIKSGVDSLKIEGRVKTQYYVATVIRSYRLAIDAYYNGTYTKELAEYLLNEIKKSSHRDFTKGFFYNKPTEEDQLYESSSYIRKYDFVGIVLDYDENTKIATIEQRNRIFKGDKLEVFGPEKEFFEFEMGSMINDKDEEVEVVPRAREIFKTKIDYPIKPWNLIRKVL